MTAKSIAVFGLAVLLALGTWGQANTIAPGGSTTSPDVFTDSPTALAFLSTGTIPHIGTFRSAVYQDAGGTLEFDYQFASDPASTDVIARMTMSPFAGFMTDVGYRPVPPPVFGFSAGTVLPSSADRNAAGDTVGFNFTPNVVGTTLGEINPGQSSMVLVIRTDATAFSDFGSFSVIDGGGTTVDSVDSFNPESPVPVPVPASAWAGLLLIAALALWRLLPRTWALALSL